MTMFIFQRIDHKTTNETHIPFAYVDAEAKAATNDWTPNAISFLSRIMIHETAVTNNL